MFFFALSNILFMYQLSLNQTKFVFSLIAAVLLEIILIAFFHQTLTQVIWILLVIGAILFLINILFVFWNYRGFPSNLRKKSTG